MNAGRRVARDDAGAYLVLYALLAVVILSVVALVIDIAALRQGRRADRAAADLSATAAAAVLDPLQPSSVAQACQAAWDYVVLNRDDADGTVSPPDCSTTFAPVPVCDPTTPVTSTGTYGPLTVSITHPVPDTDPLMRSEVLGGDLTQSVDAARDGTPCQRVAVRIERERTFLFSGITGSDSGRTDVHAVARRVLQTGPDVPAAVALESQGCNGVLVDPGTSLSITPAVAGDPDIMVVDTDLSSCPAPGAAVQITSATLNVDEIEAYALSGPNAARTVAGLTAATLTRVPTRLGRAFLDLRYDCGAPCSQTQGHLTALRSQYASGVPLGLTPASSCTVADGTSVTISADTFADCPEVRIDGKVTFTGSRLVLGGDLVIGATGCLAVNASGCDSTVGIGVTKPAVVVYVRGGITKEAKGNLILTNTFVYATTHVTIPLADPFGTSELRWTAPQSGNFEDLLLWTDTSTDVLLGEQQVTSVEGTLAAPNATIAFEGKGSPTPLAVQPVAARLRVEGTAPVILSPSAGRATGRVARQVKLVR